MHKSSGFIGPTSNYLVTKHMRGIAKHRPSIDIRSPLSTRDLKRIIKALSLTGCTTFTLALLNVYANVLCFSSDQ